MDSSGKRKAECCAESFAPDAKRIAGSECSTRDDSSSSSDAGAARVVPQRKAPLSLQTLATAAVRRLRQRLIGLDSLPVNLIKAIIDGSTREELLAIEANNADVVKSAFWDDFWQPLCMETWPPHLIKTKKSEISWRSFYFEQEKDSQERLKKAAQKCRTRLDDIKNQRNGLIVLEEAPRPGGGGGLLAAKKKSFQKVGSSLLLPTPRGAAPTGRLAALLKKRR